MSKRPNFEGPDGGPKFGKRQNTRQAMHSPFSPVDSTNLLRMVTATPLFYDSCRAASGNDFPDSLPNSFQNSEQYRKTFMPLIIEEARGAIKSAFSDACESDSYFEASITRAEVQGGGWMRISVNLGQFQGRTVHPRIFQSLVVFTNLRANKRDPVDNLIQKLRRTRGKPTAAVVGMTTQFDKDKGLVTLLVKPVCEGHQANPSAPCHKLMETLKQASGQWLLYLTGGIVTQQRECDILNSLDKIPVLESILRPDLVLKKKLEDVPRKPLSEIGPGIRDYLQRMYDASQIDAILMCTAQFCNNTDTEHQSLPFLLIQGPPGTGKTHTVEAILNLWHLVQYERFYNSIIEQYSNRRAEGVERADVATKRTLMKPRILVCAPSNAAVDELLERILSVAFRDSNGVNYKPNLLRIGAEDAPYSDEARMVLLDTLVSNYMKLSKAEWEIAYERHQTRVSALEREISALEDKIVSSGVDVEELAAELLSDMEKLDKAETEVKRLKIVESVIEGGSSTDRATREALELNFLDNAEMVFTTLSSTGKKVFSKVNRGFETVLIDEAAQASEVSALQPLVYGCQQCVLVGDPQQLPATILSQKGKELNMERSLFARLQEAGAPVKILKCQYRMHPWIRLFPSNYFYNNVLEDGGKVLARVPECFYEHDLLKPYVVFDVPTGQQERQGGGSLQNQVEADLAAALFKELRDFLMVKKKAALAENKRLPGPVRVGVLTPYRSQTKCLTQTFTRLLGAEVASEVKIMTVDSCQGKQLDVVIFSCVRASPKSSGVGFVADIRRMNVAITRAKKALWILGNFRTLVSHPAWAALEADAKERECFVVQSTAESLFPHQDLFANVNHPTPDQPSDEGESKAKDPRLGVIKKVETTTEKEQREEADPAADYASSGAPYIPTEVCSTSSTASATDRGTEESERRQSQLMLVSHQGQAEIIGPSLGTNKAYILLDKPEGLTKLPIEVLLHAVPGLQPQFLTQTEAQRDTQLTDIVTQWFKNT